MKHGLRLLILRDSGARVQQIDLPRRVLWLLMAMPLLLVVALGLVIFFFVTRVAEAATPQPVLTQKLAARLPPSTSAAAPATPAQHAPCPSDMVLVEGNFCPNVIQKCIKHMDPEGSVLRSLRCAEYEQPARCMSNQTEPLRYCIDRDEYATAPGKQPQNQQTFAKAQATCKAQGKRLCAEREWTFACEGEAMQPYPYGFARDAQRCNTDRVNLVTPAGGLRDLRAAATDYPACKSPFGVHNLTGNIEEYVMAADGSALRKGAYWQPGANNCRAHQAHPDLDYAGVETGFRCCADAETSS